MIETTVDTRYLWLWLASIAFVIVLGLAGFMSWWVVLALVIAPFAIWTAIWIGIWAMGGHITIKKVD